MKSTLRTDVPTTAPPIPSAKGIGGAVFPYMTVR